MSKLPIISGKELVDFLTKNNFTIRRQTGSHIILRQENPFKQTVVPNHKTLDRGTLRAILKQTGVNPEKFKIK